MRDYLTHPLSMSKLASRLVGTLIGMSAAVVALSLCQVLR